VLQLHLACVAHGATATDTRMAAAVSRRKHLFSSAASSGVRGGTNRVFHSSGLWRFGHDSQCAKTASRDREDLIENTKLFHPLSERVITPQEDDLNFSLENFIFLAA